MFVCLLFKLADVKMSPNLPTFIDFGTVDDGRGRQLFGVSITYHGVDFVPYRPYPFTSNINTTKTKDETE